MIKKLFQILNVLEFVCLTCFASTEDPTLYSWKCTEMYQDCQSDLTIQVNIDNDASLHAVKLKLSMSHFIPGTLKVRTRRQEFYWKGRQSCQYRGESEAFADVYASLFRNRLVMTFEFNGSTYCVEKSNWNSESRPVAAVKYEPHKIYPSRGRWIYPSGRLEKSNRESAYGAVRRKKRALTLQSSEGAAVRKVLELAVVLDRSFVNKSGSEGSAVSRVMQVTNYVNGVYMKLGLQVVLTSIVIWPSDQIIMSNSSTNTLTAFSVYCATQLITKYDIVVLMSSMLWDNGSTNSLVWLKSSCERLFSNAIVSDQYDAITMAMTLAQNIGFNLGFGYDEAQPVGCTCSKFGACVMSLLSGLNSRQVLNWSSCSVDAWKSQVNETWRSCLSDAPETSYSSSRSSVCGNGIVETGEQCDCGPAESCTSTCCSAATCQFKSGAACATGPCCDSGTCTMKARGSECRSAVGPCDVPETCSGSSELCPSDDKIADGADCASGQAYCYKGQCKTTDAQCRAFYTSAATTASSTCFTDLNIRGDIYGHCQMQLQSVRYVGYFNGSYNFNTTYLYPACASANAECGLLHCVQSTVPTTGNRYTFSATGIACYAQPRIDLSSSGLRSPSLVPDGSKCGINSMCVNSICTPLATVKSCPTCPSCYDNGVLTTGKVCFCNAGFAPPNCVTAGCGGSVTSPLNNCVSPVTTQATAAKPAFDLVTVASSIAGAVAALAGTIGGIVGIANHCCSKTQGSTSSTQAKKTKRNEDKQKKYVENHTNLP